MKKTKTDTPKVEVKAETKKITRCQDCYSYRKPNCKITGDFVARKFSCGSFSNK